jgi:hypothetical protein
VAEGAGVELGRAVEVEIGITTGMAVCGKI